MFASTAQHWLLTAACWTWCITPSPKECGKISYKQHNWIRVHCCRWEASTKNRRTRPGISVTIPLPSITTYDGAVDRIELFLIAGSSNRTLHVVPLRCIVHPDLHREVLVSLIDG